VDKTIYSIALEKDIEKIIHLFQGKLNKSFNKKIINAYSKYLNVKLLNSKNFLKLHEDFHNNNLKDIYFFENFELLLLSKIFCKIKKIKSDVKISYLKYVFNILSHISKILYWIIVIKTILQTNKVKKKNYFYFENIKNETQKKYKSLIKLNALTIDRFFLYRKCNIHILKIFKNTKYNIFKYIYYFEIELKFEIYSSSLKKLKPKKIFFIEGDSSDQDLISIISIYLNIDTYCFQWGSFIHKNIKYGFKNMSHKYFFTWGKNYSNELKKYNKKTKFISVGNPQIKRITPHNKILILLHPKTVFINSEENKKFDEFINSIINKFPEKIIIRNHPSSEYKYQFNNKKIVEHDSKQIPIVKSLNQSFCCVSIRSSAILEAARLGIIPIVFNRNHNILEKNLLILKNINSKSLFFKDSSQAMRFLISIEKNKILRNKFSKILIKKFKVVIRNIDKNSIKSIRHKIKLS
jgi:hypothetical protein